MRSSCIVLWYGAGRNLGVRSIACGSRALGRDSAHPRRLRNGVTRGDALPFARAWLISGARTATGEILCFLNNDTVLLPGYVRADASAYFTVNRQARLQLNIENLTDKTYYLHADSNTNISPGFPRTVRVALIARF